MAVITNLRERSLSLQWLVRAVTRWYAGEISMAAVARVAAMTRLQWLGWLQWREISIPVVARMAAWLVCDGEISG